MYVVACELVHDHPFGYAGTWAWLDNIVISGMLCRFLFSLKIDTGKEVHVCQGEPKMDKKQAQESAAITMLAHLTEKGIIRS